jgi:hypothetical protein
VQREIPGFSELSTALRNDAGVAAGLMSGPRMVARERERRRNIQRKDEIDLRGHSRGFIRRVCGHDHEIAFIIQ